MYEVTGLNTETMEVESAVIEGWEAAQAVAASLPPETFINVAIHTIVWN